MQILHYVQKYYPVIGGSERSVRELSTELARMGNNVYVFTTNALELHGYRCPKYINQSHFNDSGVKVNRFHVINSEIYTTLTKGLNFINKKTDKIGIPENNITSFSKALSNSPLIPSLFRTLANSHFFDVVNGTMYYCGELFFMEKICRKNYIPFIFTPRSHILEPLFFKESAPWLQIARNATAVIVFTPPEKNYYINKGISPEKIFITGIGVRQPSSQLFDKMSFKRKHKIPIDHKIILQIGRMEKYKGLDLTIEAMKEVWKKQPDTYLVIIGKSTSYTNEIKRIAQKEKRIVVIPDASEEEKNEVLYCSNILVHPSKQESFGRVFLEAWAVEKPVIGTRTAVNDFLIDNNKDGLIIEEYQPKELAKKIIFLLENEEKSIAMGKNGKIKYLENFTWDKIALRTYQVYQWAVEQLNP